MRLNASPDNLAKNAASLGRNSYNKSVPHACWLVRRCDALLRERDERTAASGGKRKPAHLTQQRRRVRKQVRRRATPEASSSHKRITEELELTPADQMKTHNSP